ncbi:uncharacterized protein LOC116256901 isoform X2 [Nymphaea colorata]|uniref:uncharacterized protein LOC116256901 isoform X2 n=1 Tax=Nymphaea colorata TaxID=210225 RepID=UPI00129E2238|nr:uncharacterized protein LOC116256901 isoform X2 [Nymphaea colorata]
MAGIMRSPPHRKSNESFRLILTTLVGIVVGYFVGASLPSTSLLKVDLLNIRQNAEHNRYLERLNSLLHRKLNLRQTPSANVSNATPSVNLANNSRIYVPTNPRGAELLPPGIINASSDLYLRRLWGNPSEDLVLKPKYLLVLTVGYRQKDVIDAVVSKFSENFSFLLFHYDGKTSEWDQFEWSKRAIHVSARKQAKWWFAKRFLHPDILAAYDYIFIWDEDLGVEHFNAEEYLKLVRKYGLEISQPALEENNALTWLLTRRRTDVEIHKETQERPGWCRDPHLPPCAGFVEIMAPVFSMNAWRCVWHMIQNDLVHGWGLDLALQRCVEPAHEKIGVVDAQWIIHMVLPSLGDQGEGKDGRQPWEGVRARCKEEWTEFRIRMEEAEKEFHSSSVQ